MKAILIKSKFSQKFGLKFPANIPLNCSEDLSAVEHNNVRNVWMKVKKTDIKII